MEFEETACSPIETAAAKHNTESGFSLCFSVFLSECKRKTGFVGPPGRIIMKVIDNNNDDQSGSGDDDDAYCWWQ